MTMHHVVPENIHTPTTEDHWKFRGRGGVKGQYFPRGRGVSWEATFPKDTNHVQNIEKNILTYVLLKQKSVLR